MSEYAARLSCIPFLQFTVVSFSVIHVASTLFSLIHHALWLIFTKSVIYNVFPPFLFLFIFFGYSYKNKPFLRGPVFLIAVVFITSYDIFCKQRTSCYSQCSTQCSKSFAVLFVLLCTLSLPSSLVGFFLLLFLFNLV